MRRIVGQRYAQGVDRTLDEWFAEEILVHEEILMRYLHRTWSNRDEAFDIRQDAYVRVYEAASGSRPVSPKAFLFATARNLMADRIRRDRVVSIEVMGDLESLNVSMDEPEPSEKADVWQELKALALAFDALPPRCREVVWLNKVDELTYQQVAERLGVTQKTVEKQMTKGVRRLAASCWSRTPDSPQGWRNLVTGKKEASHD